MRPRSISSNVSNASMQCKERYFISYPRSSYPQNYPRLQLHLVSQMRNPILSLTAVALLTIAGTTRVSAICPGYNFGIADTGPSAEDPELGTWEVFDDSCNVMKEVITSNPCTEGTFDCSPAPITFTGLHLNGLNYACRGDPNSGTCGGFTIQVCCRNDGN